MLIIACLSQKGGVGKSTIARLVAQTYASAGWAVKIADFNVRQLTSVDWTAARLKNEILPAIAAEPYNSVYNFKREQYDLLVVDGKPDSDISSLEIARVADLILVPTGLSFDDVKPQLYFAGELVKRGISRDRILFVLNKVADSDLAVEEVRDIIETRTGYRCAKTELSARVAYQNAQNAGRSVAETAFVTLNDKAISLGNEIFAWIADREKASA